MATMIEAGHEELAYSSYSGSEEEEEGHSRGGLRSAVVVQNNTKITRLGRSPSPISNQSPPAKRLRGASPDEKWVEKKKEIDPILTRTGGAYIPPARLRMLRDQIQDKSSVAYQRMSWEALKKSINGLINKVNVANIKNIIAELFQENVVRGRGLLVRSIITAQIASPTFTHVYAALVAVINTKFPQIGELVAKRLILQFKRAFRRNDKTTCLSSVTFIAHLVNQQMVHELLALELITVLLEDPTGDSVEVAIGFLKGCGLKLTQLSPRGIHGVFESLKGILHDGTLDVRVQYMIEVMFAIRKDSFKEHPSVISELELVEEDDQITHLLSLEDELTGEDHLNVFKADPDFLENEEKYRQIKEEMLGGSDVEGDSDESGEDEDDDEDEDEAEEQVTIEDMTETNLLALRRTIYLTIMSSLDFEETAHKILKMSIKPGQEMEVANMIIECCSQERSYQRFYGLLGERFCHLNQMWVEHFDATFQQQYATVHRLETNKLRNVAKFYAQLFYTDALPWTCLACVHLNEEETNSSSRIFVKILFQELAEYMGLPRLNDRLKDPFLSTAFEGLMPRDNPRNTRFAINFFTSIGLGGLTDDLREHLKNAPKLIMAQHQAVQSDSSSDDDSSSSNESSSSSEEEDSDSSSTDSESSSEDTDSEEERRRRRRKEKMMDKAWSHRESGQGTEPRDYKSINDMESKRKRRRRQDDGEVTFTRNGNGRHQSPPAHRRSRPTPPSRPSRRSRSPPSRPSHRSRSPPSRPSRRSRSPPSRPSRRPRSPPSRPSRRSRSPPPRPSHRSRSPPSKHRDRSPPSFNYHETRRHRRNRSHS